VEHRTGKTQRIFAAWVRKAEGKLAVFQRHRNPGSGQAADKLLKVWGGF
jgi:hypothetical protein